LLQKILDKGDSPGVGAFSCLGNVDARQKRLCGNDGAQTTGRKPGGVHFREQFNQNKYHEIYAEAIQVFPDAAPESEASAFFDMVHQKLRDEPGDCGARYFANVSTRGTSHSPMTQNWFMEADENNSGGEWRTTRRAGFDMTSAQGI